MNKFAMFVAIAATTLAATTAMADEGASTESAPPPVAAAPASHGASHEREFGDVGTINIGASTGLDAFWQSDKAPNDSKTTITRFGLGLDGAYFVIPNVSVGGHIGFDRSSVKGEKDSDSTVESAFGIMVTGGYNHWLTPGSLSVWPQLGLGWERRSFDVPGSTTGGTTSTSSQRVTIASLYVPVLYHAASHLHFGVGPFFKMDLTSTLNFSGSDTDGSKRMTFGLMGEIAGWL